MRPPRFLFYLIRTKTKEAASNPEVASLHVFFRFSPIRFEVHIQPLQRLLATVRVGTQELLITAKNCLQVLTPYANRI